MAQTGGPRVVFHVPGVLAEPQLPDIEEELKKWKLGDAMLDAKARAGAHNRAPQPRRGAAASSLAGFHSASPVPVDPIRLSTAPDQLLLQSFMALHLPVSLRDKQVTNFEVRRLMQRTRGKRAYSLHSSSSGASSSPLEKLHQVEVGNGSDEKTGIDNSKTRNHNESSPSSSRSIIMQIDEAVLHRKGAELQQIIRGAARDRASQMPLPSRRQQQPGDEEDEGTDRRARNDDDGPQQGKPHKNLPQQRLSPRGEDNVVKNLSLSPRKNKDLQLWYHRLGL